MYGGVIWQCMEGSYGNVWRGHVSRGHMAMYGGVMYRGVIWQCIEGSYGNVWRGHV